MPYNFDSKVCLKNMYVKGICNKYKCDVEKFRQLKWWRRNWIAFYDSSSPNPPQHGFVGCNYLSVAHFLLFLH